jgi:hypothetical protein
MVFEVTQSLTITMNGFQSSIKTRFEIEFLIHEKTEDKRIYIIKKAKVATLPISDNDNLKVVEELEWHTYPIKIATNLEGHFFGMLEHEEWLGNWEKNTQSIIKEYGNSANVKDIWNKYYEVAKDEKAFVANKFKEPFWNLLFFNPPIDNANQPDLGTTLNWNIKSIGIMPCVGKTKVRNPDASDVVIYFESQQRVGQDIIEGLESKARLQNVRWDDQKGVLQVASTFDTVQRKLKSKKALFEFIIKGHFSYVEETVIEFKRIDQVTTT